MLAYVGPMLALCWAILEAMLGICWLSWAYVEDMLGNLNRLKGLDPQNVDYACPPGMHYQPHPWKTQHFCICQSSPRRTLVCAIKPIKHNHFFNTAHTRNTVNYRGFNEQEVGRGSPRFSWRGSAAARANIYNRRTTEGPPDRT